jgi:hypothetical protein
MTSNTKNRPREEDDPHAMGQIKIRDATILRKDGDPRFLG